LGWGESYGNQIVFPSHRKLCVLLFIRTNGAENTDS